MPEQEMPATMPGGLLLLVSNQQQPPKAQR